MSCTYKKETKNIKKTKQTFQKIHWTQKVDVVSKLIYANELLIKLTTLVSNASKPSRTLRRKIGTASS